MTQKEFFFKRGFSDHKSRQLIFHQDFLKIQDKDFVGNEFSNFPKSEIESFRFGIRWIRFELTYGREYQIWIKSKKGKIAKITFKSYFGRKKNELHELYINILDSLYDFYLSEMIERLLAKFRNDEEIEIGDMKLDSLGVSFSIGPVIRQKRVTVSWERLRSKNYHSYFSVYSSENPKELNRGYSYLEDWNTAILYSVVRTILKDKEIETYE